MENLLQIIIRCNKTFLNSMGFFDDDIIIGKDLRIKPKKTKSPARNTLKGDEIKILERQDHKCANCGKKLLPHRYHIDHKKPVALNGTNTIQNKQALCPDCHDRKTREDKTKIAKVKQKEKAEKKPQGRGFFGG